MKLLRYSIAVAFVLARGWVPYQHVWRKGDLIFLCAQFLSKDADTSASLAMEKDPVMLMPPSHPTTLTISAAAMSRTGAITSFISCALLVVLPCMASADDMKELTAETKAAAVAAPEETSDALSLSRMQAAERLAADRIAIRTTKTVDTIAISQEVAIDESLRGLTNKSMRLSDVVAMRIDAQLTGAMTNFRVNAYAKTQTKPSMSYQVANQHKQAPRTTD